MGVCDLKGTGHLLCDVDEVSIRLVSRPVIGLLRLKFGLAFRIRTAKAHRAFVRPQRA